MGSLLCPCAARPAGAGGGVGVGMTGMTGMTPTGTTGAGGRASPASRPPSGSAGRPLRRVSPAGPTVATAGGSGMSPRRPARGPRGPPPRRPVRRAVRSAAASADAACSAVLPSSQVMLLQPCRLGGQGLGPLCERTQERAADRREVGPPTAERVGLDMAGADNLRRPEGREVQVFAVQAADGAAGIDDDVQGKSSWCWGWCGRSRGPARGTDRKGVNTAPGRAGRPGPGAGKALGGPQDGRSGVGAFRETGPALQLP
jgi:hypothetical protein